MNINLIKGNTLIVIEQKGSDPEECRERFLAGCSLFKKISANQDLSCHLLIVGGANNGNSPKTIRSWCPSDLLDVLVINNEAANTHEKAVSILEFITSHKIETVIQVTSLYHSLRAFLTTLRSIKEQLQNVVFLNYVADSIIQPAIHFALIDEILLAKSINENISFSYDSADIEFYLQNAGTAKADAGFTKYLHKRYAEASRVVEYSEIGKNHVMTNITLPEIINSYLVV